MRASRLITVLVLSLVGTAFLSVSARAATVRHVAPTGTDVGNCSVNHCKTIGYAIIQSVSGDTIRIAGGTYSEHIVVDRSLTLEGAGTGSTFIDGYSSGTVVTISSSSSSLVVRLARLTIRHGSAPRGGGLASLPGTGQTNRIFLNLVNISHNQALGTLDAPKAKGGGIYNGAASNMTITRSTVSANSATGASGACGSTGREGCQASGGGINNAGTLMLFMTTVWGDSALGGNGGILCHYPYGGYGYPGGNGLGGGVHGSVTLVNSTVSADSATGGNAGNPPRPLWSPSLSWSGG